MLWEEGIYKFNISKRENFQLRAALMWTINDFPAFLMLSRWSTTGRYSYPYSMDDSQAFNLEDMFV